MADGGNIGGIQLPVAQVGSLLSWLIKLGVTSQRLAALFGTTAVNVRVAASRARRAQTLSFASSQRIDKAPSGSEKLMLGIREKDEVLATRLRDQRVLDRRDLLLDAVNRHRRDYMFEAGIAELKLIVPLIGRPADIRLIALLAEIHHHLGWFHTHLGQSASALEETSVAMDLWRAAYNEAHEGSAIRRNAASEFVKSGLVASQLHLLAQRPGTALDILDIAEAAAQTISQPIGSDFFRQRGVAMFQLGEDDESKRQFETTYTTMLDRGEASTPASAPMASLRHTYALGRTPNYDSMMEIRELADRAFGRQSLEYSMITNWSAAAGLLTDSQALHNEAHELLLSNAAVGAEFGHQRTVMALLSIADELGLYPALRKRFIRRALYENTSRLR